MASWKNQKRSRRLAGIHSEPDRGVQGATDSAAATECQNSRRAVDGYVFVPGVTESAGKGPG